MLFAMILSTLRDGLSFSYFHTLYMRGYIRWDLKFSLEERANFLLILNNLFFLLPVRVYNSVFPGGEEPETPNIIKPPLIRVGGHVAGS